ETAPRDRYALLPTPQPSIDGRDARSSSNTFSQASAVSSFTAPPPQRASGKAPLSSRPPHLLPTNIIQQTGPFYVTGDSARIQIQTPSNNTFGVPAHFQPTPAAT